MRTRGSVTWACLLGFALGGFFDGILLHQILQWHHLLSQVSGMDDLRLQVLWDGYFHALMYVLALVALWGLWRHRSGAGMLAGMACGFGLWHIVDGVASHWLLGIHRIRLDSPNPLLWDLLWFAVFGIVPLVLGWRWLRRGHPPGQGARAATLLVTGFTLGAALWAAQPGPQDGLATVVFRPGMDARQVFAALDAADARLAWSDARMGVVVVSVAPERRARFYRAGALLVSGTGLPAGCASWTRLR